MSNPEDNLSNEIKEQQKLIAENLKVLDEDTSSKDSKHIPEKEQNPDYDDYYEIKDDEEPELKLEKGQTIEQLENESGDYY